MSTRKTADTDIAQGVVQVQDDQVKVATGTGGTTKDIPVKNAQYMIDEATYGKEVRRNPGFLYGWNGALTAGATTGGGDAEQPRLYRRGRPGTRTIPTVDWLDPRNRTHIRLSPEHTARSPSPARRAPRPTSSTSMLSMIGISRPASTSWWTRPLITITRKA